MHPMAATPLDVTLWAELGLLAASPIVFIAWALRRDYKQHQLAIRRVNHALTGNTATVSALYALRKLGRKIAAVMRSAITAATLVVQLTLRIVLDLVRHLL